MNLIHRELCASAYWQTTVQTKILPWVLADFDLGGQVLEVGAGWGAASDSLSRQAAHVTCVEIDPDIAGLLAHRMATRNVTVLCEDATRMSLGNSAFDAAISVAMLHHLPSPALQDQLLAEVARVLRPGGTFVGFDATSGPLLKLLHLGDTLVPIDPRTFPTRLTNAGFSDISIDVRARGFRFRARRAIH